MKLYNKYKDSKFKTFVSVDNEDSYYKFLNSWQNRHNLNLRLLSYAESNDGKSLDFIVKCNIGRYRFLIEVSCCEPRVSFAIICTSATNINLLLNQELLK